MQIIPGCKPAPGCASVSLQWYHKIDRALLESAGIATATLNPATLGVFGYGGGMLPEANDDHNPDDVVELPLYKVGLDDGSFDDGDYVLFYGESPNQWTYNETTDAYRQYNHLYANRTSYFISPDRGTNSTLSTRNNWLESPTYTTSSYDTCRHGTMMCQPHQFRQAVLSTRISPISATAGIFGYHP